MTNGQVQQLQTLSKCYLTRRDSAWYRYLMMDWYQQGKKFIKANKKQLRRLMYQYRHQIKAIKRNQKP